MHVLLLNQAFFPDVVATAQIAKDLADALVSRGHRVTAVASRSLYGEAGATLAPREEVDGITIVRVGASLFGKSGLAARAADFGLFYVRSALAAAGVPRPDVIVALTTPPFIGGLAVALGALHGARVVQWVMDLYPDVPIALGLLREGTLPARLLEQVSRTILRRSDAAVVLGRCMAQRLREKGLDSAKIHVIPVWSSEALAPASRADNPYRARFDVEGRFAVMYSGNLGLGHDVATVCEAMARLADEPHIRFVWVGGGKRYDEVRRFAEERGLSNARFFGYVPRAELGLSLAAGDVHLVSLRRGLAGHMVPSKLFGAMAVGRAAIYVGEPEGEGARILHEHDAGRVIEEGDVDGLVATLRELARDEALTRALGERARAAFVGRYDAETACAAWLALLEGLAP